jgi:beta-glucosidase
MTSFPQGFLWGTATAAHQVEGNNINSDFWVLEHLPGTIFAEPSGDACDHYRLYRQDLHLLKDLGFTSYRFSIEWARVEPEDGVISRAALAHYRDVLETCHELGLTPMVTLHHFTSPRWLMKLGGWENPTTPQRLAAYSQAVMQELGALIPYCCTINEANIPSLIRHMNRAARQEAAGTAQAPVGVGSDQSDPFSMANLVQAAAREFNTTPENVKPLLFAMSDEAVAIITEAHERAAAAVKATSPGTRVGITLALNDVQVLPGGEALAAEIWSDIFERYLPACAGDDFIGVQNYSRQRVGPSGVLPNEDGVPVTQMGYEYYPEALEHVIRTVAASVRRPIIVTENGLSSVEDAPRVEFIARALGGVQRCLADGIDVRGYYYWSAMDNFEWMLGYRPQFGLIAVDRATQRRHVKESARYLGAIAQRNGLPD